MNRIRLVALLLGSASMATAQTGPAGLAECKLTLSQAPVIRGIRLGMNVNEARALFPGETEEMRRTLWQRLSQGSGVQTVTLGELQDHAESTVFLSKGRIASAEATFERDKADLLFAESEFNRHQELSEKGVANQSQVNSAKSRYDKSRAAVASQQTKINELKATLHNAQFGKERFAGVKSVYLGFLDGQLSFFMLYYDDPEWSSKEQFASKVSEALNLPAFSWDPLIEMMALNCQGFSVNTTLHQEGPRIFVMSHPQIDFDEVLGKGAGEAKEKERPRRVFKP
jgi:hypothetical protein